jgi:peroxiredoxin (alkyl hydroperoxide reductase subunit C)
MLKVGDQFPHFRAKACVGIDDKSLTEITSDTHKGKWSVYIFYPKDFTFVCPTELVEFGRKVKEFQDRDAVLYGASTDNEYSHLAWRRSHNDLRTLSYPLLAAQKLAGDLGILDPQENVCLRATYIVDPHGVIQWVSVNPLSVGRSVPEVLRVLDGIQSDELCPCNWKSGDPYLKAG